MILGWYDTSVERIARRKSQEGQVVWKFDHMPRDQVFQNSSSSSSSWKQIGREFSNNDEDGRDPNDFKKKARSHMIIKQQQQQEQQEQQHQSMRPSR